MAQKGEKIMFKNHHRQLKVLFVIYADFEAITEKVDSCKPNDSESYQKHTDCSYGYKVAFCYKMTHEDEKNFKQAKVCHICNKKYNKTDKRVRDHCHVTGKYRGSAHESCNLNFRFIDKIPVIFHNLRGYDSHFIMQQIGEIAKNHKYMNKNGEEKEMLINAIPNNMEKYMAFMLDNNLVFTDSFQFVSSSLDKLVSNLPKESLKYTSEIFKGKALDLMSKKGVYPY